MQLKGVFWEVIGGEGNLTLQGTERDLDHVTEGQRLHLLLPEHSGHPFHQSMSNDSTEARLQQSTCVPPSEKRVTTGWVHQPTTARRRQPAEKTKLLPALGRCAGLALQRALPQLSKGFLLPYGGKLSILTHSQPDVKGLQPVLYNIFLKGPLRINNFYCNFQLHHALIKLD